MESEALCLSPSGPAAAEGLVASGGPVVFAGVRSGGSCWPVSCGTVTSELMASAGAMGRPLTLPRAQDKVMVTDWCCDVCDSRAVSGRAPLALPHSVNVRNRAPEARAPTPLQCTEQARPTAARARARTLSHTSTLAHTQPAGPRLDTQVGPFPRGLEHSQGVAGDLRQNDVTLWPKGCALLGPFCRGLLVRPHMCRTCCGHGLRPLPGPPPREPPRGDSAC